MAYSFDEVLRVADTLRTGTDVAIASRVHADSRVVVPAHLQGYAYRRHVQSQLFSWIVRCLLPLPQSDTQAGLKGLTARAADLVLPYMRCDGFGFDCELLTACVRLGLTVTEVPVNVSYEEDMVSTTSLGGVVRMVRELLKVRQDWRRPLPRAVNVPSEPHGREAA